MDFIAEWREKGILKPEQASVLSQIESGRLFSLSAELRAMLYLGALLVVAGVGGTVKKYMLELGPAAITSALSAAVCACLYYCFARVRPYSPEQVESPTAAFDYVLYLGCAFIGILFAYLEAHYHILKDYWDYYLLASAFLFLWFGYRFDNRMVLAMGLANLGAWFGLRFTHFDIPLFGLRSRALMFGTLTLAAGWLLSESWSIKPHFKDTYYVIACHVLFWAALWGLFEEGRVSLYTPAVALLTAAAIAYAVSRRSFQYFLYGSVYGYIGLSYLILKDVHFEEGLIFLYFSLSSIAVVVGIFMFRRSLEQDA